MTQLKIPHCTAKTWHSQEKEKAIMRKCYLDQEPGGHSCRSNYRGTSTASKLSLAAPQANMNLARLLATLCGCFIWLSTRFRQKKQCKLLAN